MILQALNTHRVTPAQAGAHPEIIVPETHLRMDSGLRRNDIVIEKTLVRPTP